VRFGVIVAASLVLATMACSNDTVTGGKSKSPQVTVNDNFFTPSSVTIAAGDTVIWIWGGNAGHNVAFTTSGAPADCPTYSSDGICIRVFPTPGTYNYVCVYHGGMTGSVTVN